MKVLSAFILLLSFPTVVTSHALRKQGRSENSELEGFEQVIGQRSLAAYCSSGVLSGSVCCASSCGTCGGSGCSKRNGGASKCCTGTITDAGRTCTSSSDTACLVPEDSGWCSNGITAGDKCCAASCGSCGGTGCSQRPGGASKCCGGQITKTCTDSADTACVIPEESIGGTCGNGSRGDGVCSDGTCCSQYGWCGTTSAHCSGNTSLPPPTGGSSSITSTARTQQISKPAWIVTTSVLPRIL